MSSSPLAVFADLVEYIDESLIEADASCDNSDYPKAAGRLEGALRVIRMTLAGMTAERAFDHIYDDPDTLFLERVSTDVYDDALREFFDDGCLQAAE